MSYDFRHFFPDTMTTENPAWWRDIVELETISQGQLEALLQMRIIKLDTRVAADDSVPSAYCQHPEIFEYIVVRTFDTEFGPLREFYYVNTEGLDHPKFACALHGNTDWEALFNL